MTTDPRRFNLSDGNGNPHSYEIFYLKPSEALPIALEILSLGSGPLLRLIEKSLDMEQAEDVGDVQNVLKNLDFSAIGQDVRASIASLQSRPDLVRALFRGTLRDGKDLSSDMLYDAAYEGNWTEWYQALFAIVKANGFLSFFGSLSMSNG